MTTLFPPILESQRESIWFYGEAADNSFDLNFQMPAINDQSSDIKHIQVSIKYKSLNRSALDGRYCPDGVTLFYSLRDKNDVTQSGLPPTDTKNGWKYDEATRVCSLAIPYYLFEGGIPKNGCEYTIQMRFGANALWDESGGPTRGWHFKFEGFSYWHNLAVTNVPSPFGEWSNLQKVFCIKRAGTAMGISVSHSFVPTVEWTYSPSLGENGEIQDAIEQIILQWDWDTDNGLGETVRQFRTQTFDGQFNSSDILSFSQEVPIAPVVPIHFSLTAVTQHNSVYVNNAILNPFDADGNQRIFKNGLVTCTFSDYELKDAQTDDGCIAKSVAFDKGYNQETLRFYRYDLKTLDCILVKSVTIETKERNLDGTWGKDISAIYTMKDFTVAMGEEYQYIPVVVDADNNITLCADLAEQGEGTTGYARLMSMEVTFLTDRYHQLRVPGNLKITSFKRNTSDVFQATIGGKYPFYIRNGAQNYRTLQVSAVISINFDPTFTFLRLDDQYGLIWESADARTLLIDKKDIFGVEDFSNSRWRLGHPLGDKKERAKIEALGNDALAKWALLDSQRDNIEKNILRMIKPYLDKGIEQSVAEMLFERESKTSPDGIIFKNFLEQRAEKDAEMQKYYVNRRVSSQQYAADYDGKTVYNQRLLRNNTTTIGTSQTDEMIYIERKFRDAVMSWLSDGKPKLYRSETEGNMIVVVSAPTFTPLDKTQRMVYSVSMTLTEIAEFNLQNLIEYNLIPAQIISEYIPKREWEIDFGNPDPWLVAIIGLNYEPKYDIPTIKIEKPIEATVIRDIDMTQALVNNYYPNFLWLADGLPQGFYLDPFTGILSCNKSELVPTKRGNATIMVYDRFVFPTDETEKDRIRRLLSYRNYPSPRDVSDPTSWTAEEAKKMEYVNWWNQQMATRHDYAEMTINTGEIYNKFLIGWSTTNNFAQLDNFTEPEITVEAVGEKIDPIYFGVLPGTPGVPPYTWAVGERALPLGLSLNPVNAETDFNNRMCVLEGVFQEATDLGGSFQVTCTDSKYQVVSINVTYHQVHQPVQLISKSDTSVLTDWEQGWNIPEVDFSLQRRYGVTNEPKNFAYEMLFYTATGELSSAEADSYIPGITLSVDGKLNGMPIQITKADDKLWPEYYYKPEKPIVIRVYDLEDECPADSGATDRAEYNGKIYRMSQIDVTIDTILRKLEFIKPDDIDVVQLYGDNVQVGFTFTNPYEIMSKILDDGLPPVRGGRSRTSYPTPYEFYARAYRGDSILANFSVGSAGRFTSTCVQTSQAGILEIVAVDGRGHEVSIEINIPEVVGPMQIIPVPSNKFVIPATYVGNPEDKDKEWFRVYCDLNDPTVPITDEEKEKFMDDVRGEQGEFKNFQISVEGLPAGVTIKYVSDETPPYFSFSGAPIGTTGDLTAAQLDAAASTVKNIDWNKYGSDKTYKGQVDAALQAAGINVGSGPHFATMKITDDFTVEVNGVKEKHPRTAAANILIEGVAAPLIWGGRDVYIDPIPADQCVNVIAIVKDGFSGGQGPYTWKADSLKDLEPYTVVPGSSESDGGFDSTTPIYIVGHPSKSQPAKDVKLTVVDANGLEQSITVHVGEIYGSIGITEASDWAEDFIVGISNASNGHIRVAYPNDSNGDYTFLYNGMKNAILPNGMILSPDGYLKGKATTKCSSINIGPNIIIIDNKSGQDVKCPNWTLPATVDPPKVNPALTLTNGKFIVAGLEQNNSYDGPPLFVWNGRQSAAIANNGDTLPQSLVLNTSTYEIKGNLDSETNTDIIPKYTFAVGGNNAVTPRVEVTLDVVFKPIAAPFTLESPPSTFSIPALTVGVPMAEVNVGKWNILHGGTEPITWEYSGIEGYGIIIDYSRNNGRTLIISGTPTQKAENGLTLKLKAKDARGLETNEIEIRFSGIYDPLKLVQSQPVNILGGTANTVFSGITLTATGGLAGQNEETKPFYSWEDPTGILSEYGYEFQPASGASTTIKGTRSERNMAAYSSGERFLVLKDMLSGQELQIKVNIGAITGGLPNLSPTAFELPTRNRNTPINWDLKQYVVGTTADKNSVTFEVSQNSAIPEKWNTIKVENGAITGNYPNVSVPPPKQKFMITVMKGTNLIGQLTVTLPIVS